MKFSCKRLGDLCRVVLSLNAAATGAELAMRARARAGAG
jgi:hypothetical protein